MKKDMRKGIFAVLMVTALAVLMAVGPGTVSAAEALKPLTMTWVAGGVGGGWYVQAGGIARLITEKEPKLVVKVVPGGGMVNPVRVSSGKDDLGWGITFVDKMAYSGMAPLFEKPNPNVEGHRRHLWNLPRPFRGRPGQGPQNRGPNWPIWSRPARRSMWPCR